MSDDRIEGTADNIGGKIKDAAGGLTGDSGLQAQGKLDQLSGQAQDAYGRAKEAASDAAANISDRASDLGEQAYDQGAEAVRYIGRQVRNEPLGAIAVVAGVAFLLGYLAGRPPIERAVQVGPFRAAYRR